MCQRPLNPLTRLGITSGWVSHIFVSKPSTIMYYKYTIQVCYHMNSQLCFMLDHHWWDFIEAALKHLCKHICGWVLYKHLLYKVMHVIGCIQILFVKWNYLLTCADRSLFALLSTAREQIFSKSLLTKIVLHIHLHAPQKCTAPYIDNVCKYINIKLLSLA